MRPLGSSEAGINSRFPAVPSKRHASRGRHRTQRGNPTHRLFRMPPSSRGQYPLPCDLSLTRQVPADAIAIVEPPIVDRQNGGVTNAARFETAELRAL